MGGALEKSLLCCAEAAVGAEGSPGKGHVGVLLVWSEQGPLPPPRLLEDPLLFPTVDSEKIKCKGEEVKWAFKHALIIMSLGSTIV